MDNSVKKYASHLSSLCGIECGVLNMSLKTLSECRFCKSCPVGCDYINTHLYGCWEAHRWGGKYIYYCPAGFTFVAATVTNEAGMPDVGVLAGPIIMGDINDFDYPCEAPIFSTIRVNDLACVMGLTFSSLSEKNIFDTAKPSEQLLNDIYKVSDELKLKDTHAYPIELEKDLQSAIINGDKIHARELLNTLLGHIFFSSNADFSIIKSRISELLVLLSRSAIEGGAEANRIFTINSSYTKEIERFDTLEELSIWLSSIISNYISYVFEFHDAKHTDIMHKVTAYIKNHCSEKITLSDIAEHVYLSRSYLSKIFKDEMNCGIADYINSMRVEKSKLLMLDNSLSLVDVAIMAGFDNQSYFTKVFRKFAGVSPGRYREMSGLKK